LDALGLKERSTVVRADVVRWLEGAPAAINGARFVFLDPPYEDVVMDRALKALDGVVTSATVVAEHSRRQQMPSLRRLQIDRQRRYGDSMVTVLIPTSPEAAM
jgi:16S rRNA G966 N2-methylase RsmD